MRVVDVPAPELETTAAVREAFADEIALRNLRWIWWLVVTSTVLLLVCLGVNLAVPAMRALRLWFPQLVDLGLTAVVLAELVRLRRQVKPSRWARRFPAGYVAVVFVVFDYHHLSALATAGETGGYVLGVVAVGVLVMLPPRVFLPLLLVNHAVYLALVASSPAPLRVQLLAATDGTAGVLVAGLASGLLYAARWRDFQRERLLAQSNADLVRANAEMNDLMAIAAHDLRSPLEGVRRMLGVLRTRTEWRREQIERALDTCLQSCDGIVSLVGRLLEAHNAEAEAGKTMTFVACDLRDECAAAVARVRELAEKKRQPITLAVPAVPAIAAVAPAVLGQVLDNLLSNAVKFSPAGGAIECALAEQDGAWCIEVRDAGPGVPEDERARLFQKFSRGTARPTAGESSNGLGLFIVKTLTEAMRGRVSYVPNERGGSVFGVELPAEKRVG